MTFSGMISTRQYFQPEAHVDEVFPGCPADKAGIQAGDQVIVSDDYDDDANVKDPSIPTWMFSCGSEGQSVSVIVKHKGDPKFRRPFVWFE